MIFETDRLIVSFWHSYLTSKRFYLCDMRPEYLFVLNSDSDDVRFKHSFRSRFNSFWLWSIGWRCYFKRIVASRNFQLPLWCRRIYLCWRYSVISTIKLIFRKIKPHRRKNTKTIKMTMIAAMMITIIWHLSIPTTTMALSKQWLTVMALHAEIMWIIIILAIQLKPTEFQLVSKIHFSQY